MNFRFQNLLGAPYRGGNVVLSGDATLLSPVGNRVSSTDLLKSQTLTLPIETSTNISRIAVSPDGVFLLVVDDSRRASFVNLRRRVVLHRMRFDGPVTALEFSPSGIFFAVGIGKLVKIYKSPGFKREFFSFQLENTFTECAANVTSIDWSPDSKYLLVGSKDLTVRLFSIDRSKGRRKPFLFLGHREPIVGAFFSSDKSGKVVRIYSISRDGAIFTWNLDTSLEFDEPPSPGTPEQKASDDGSKSSDRKRKYLDGVYVEGNGIPLNNRKWELVKKDFFMQAPSRLTACDYHNELDMVVVAFSNGVFGLYQMPDFVCLHLLSISKEKITAAVFNRLGNWLTFGCAKLGQLLVWEWRSESYIMKQQGHYFDVNCVSYSPDSQILATGADDNKIKVVCCFFGKWAIHILY